MPIGRVVDYSAFQGARGRDVFFRPDRYQVSDLGPIGVAVELELDGQKLERELYDVSQNGVAFDWPAELPIEIGAVLNDVVVRFDEHEAYRGSVRVSSVRREARRTIVGASFVDTLMNIEDVLELRDVKTWLGGAGTEGLGLRGAPWHVEGQQEFKSLVAELRLLLEDARSTFTRLEATLPGAVAQGEHASPARDALIAKIKSEFANDVVELSGRIDAALRLASAAERDALCQYAQRFLHDLLMQSPWMHRARHKPLGYPGDYETMNGLYGNHFAGPTLFAKAVNLAFVSTPAAEAVRARKDMIKRRLSDLLDAPLRSGPIRILSIAAGPAQEVFELLKERESLSRPVEIVLYDQDKRALGFSYSRLQRLVSAKWREEVTLVHLNDSIKHLLRGSGVFTGHGAFDAVYSCGLFDYLQFLTAVSLCRSLFELVAPGGALYVGNMVPDNPCRWFMEFHLDWYLVYRERSEMLEVGRKAAPGAALEILEERTGVNPFIALTKE